MKIDSKSIHNNHFNADFGKGFYTLPKWNGEMKVNPNGHVYAAAKVRKFEGKISGEWNIQAMGFKDYFPDSSKLNDAKLLQGIECAEGVFGQTWTEIMFETNLIAFAVKILDQNYYHYLPSVDMNKKYLSLSLGTLLQIKDAHTLFEKRHPGSGYTMTYMIGDIVRHDSSDDYYDIIASFVPELIRQNMLPPVYDKDGSSEEIKLSMLSFGVVMSYLVQLLGLPHRSSNSNIPLVNMAKYRYEQLDKWEQIPMVPKFGNIDTKIYNLGELEKEVQDFFSCDAVDKQIGMGSLLDGETSTTATDDTPLKDGKVAIVIEQLNKDAQGFEYITQYEYDLRYSQFESDMNFNGYPEVILSEIIEKFPQSIVETYRTVYPCLNVHIDMDIKNDDGDPILEKDEVFGCYVTGLFSQNYANARLVFILNGYALDEAYISVFQQYMYRKYKILTICVMYYGGPVN